MPHRHLPFLLCEHQQHQQHITHRTAGDGDQCLVLPPVQGDGHGNGNGLGDAAVMLLFLFPLDW